MLDFALKLKTLVVLRRSNICGRVSLLNFFKFNNVEYCTRNLLIIKLDEIYNITTEFNNIR